MKSSVIEPILFIFYFCWPTEDEITILIIVGFRANDVKYRRYIFV